MVCSKSKGKKKISIKKIKIGKILTIKNENLILVTIKLCSKYSLLGKNYLIKKSLLNVKT
jgi:hypothetical protein